MAPYFGSDTPAALLVGITNSMRFCWLLRRSCRASRQSRSHRIWIWRSRSSQERRDCAASAFESDIAWYKFPLPSPGNLSLLILVVLPRPCTFPEVLLEAFCCASGDGKVIDDRTAYRCAAEDKSVSPTYIDWLTSVFFSGLSRGFRGIRLCFWKPLFVQMARGRWLTSKLPNPALCDLSCRFVSWRTTSFFVSEEFGAIFFVSCTCNGCQNYWSFVWCRNLHLHFTFISIKSL